MNDERRMVVLDAERRTRISERILRDRDLWLGHDPQLVRTAHLPRQSARRQMDNLTGKAHRLVVRVARLVNDDIAPRRARDRLGRGDRRGAHRGPIPTDAGVAAWVKKRFWRSSETAYAS